MQLDTELELSVCDVMGRVKASAKGVNSVELFFGETYEEGDLITVNSAVYPMPLRLQFDAVIPAAQVWLAAPRLEFPAPLGEQHDAYPPASFGPGEKRLSVSVIGTDVWDTRRNLSENPLDRRGKTTYYPHCTATVETRNESVFAARNTIDGVVEPSCHGAWPYQSWGDNEDPDAEIMIEFGRPVCVDAVHLNLRADFPHDSYWKKAYLLFSDGSGITLHLKKTGEAQEFVFPKRNTLWVKLTKFIKNDDASPFPALTQWAVYGKEAQKS
jgi:hypothetical protein